MAAPLVRSEEEGGIAWVEIHHPPANTLNQTVLRQLFEALQAAQNNSAVKAIVLSGAGGRFSAGYDIGEFARPGGVPSDPGVLEEVHRGMATLLEGGPKPVVAAIECMAQGGGLELAMACAARVCTQGASLGLPELRLGVLPGFGGTQRLPRLVGLPPGLDMLLSSRAIEAEEAEQLGLVDMVVPKPRDLQGAACAMALEVAGGSRPWRKALEDAGKLETAEEAAAALAVVEARAAGLGRHGRLCWEAVQCGVEKGGPAGLRKEAEGFCAAAALDAHKARVQLYFVYRAAKKARGLGALPAAAAALRHFALFWIYQLRGMLLRLIGRE